MDTFEASGLRRLSDEQLYELSELLDGELDRRYRRMIGRGYYRSTYMRDRVRGPEKAPRPVRRKAA